MSDPMAAGLLGANPGAPMGPGAAMAPGGAGAQAPPADSAEFPAFKLVVAAMAGEWNGLGEFISVKAAGPLKELRTNTMTDTKKDELKKEFAQLQPLSSKAVSGGKQLTFKSGSTIITMVVKKENGAFRVSELTRRAGK